MQWELILNFGKKIFRGGDNMDTFVVTNFNQSKEVLYALESIKYQIQKFGKGRETQLIITDNCSSDNSVQVIDRWLNKNVSLFSEIDRVYRSENIGLSKNYADALKKIKGERFFVLYGDDLLSPYNVFEIIDKLDEYGIICNGCMKFKNDGEIFKDLDQYLNVVMQRFIKGKMLRYAVKLGSPILNGAVWGKELLADNVLSYIASYDTISDRACFQKIFENNPLVKVTYVNRPLILYRESEGSMSNLKSPTRTKHSMEIAQLCERQLEQKQSLGTKISLIWQKKFIMLRGKNRICNLLTYFTPYYFTLLLIYIVNNTKIKKMERELVDAHWKECQKYYLYIKKQVEQCIR